MTPIPADEERLASALTFLQEAVYRSRGDQAGATLMAAGSASCGLGEKARVALDLTPKAEVAYRALFDDRDTDLDAIRAVVRSWVERQDALDRKRNHFLRDFRGTHGADRRAYEAATLSEFEAGLERINALETQEREAAARELLALV
ncbi:MAG: hypothetical protein AAF726_20070 [Planctomycetota bacterium]